MRSQFLEKLIKKFPNHMELGGAVARYYDLRQSKLARKSAKKLY